MGGRTIIAFLWSALAGLFSYPKKQEASMIDLNVLYKQAHDKTGGEKEVDAAQHAESCAALLDALAQEKPSEVLAMLEARKK